MSWRHSIGCDVHPCTCKEDVELRARGLAEYVAPAERLVEDLATTLVREDPALD